MYPLRTRPLLSQDSGSGAARVDVVRGARTARDAGSGRVRRFSSTEPTGDGSGSGTAALRSAAGCCLFALSLGPCAAACTAESATSATSATRRARNTRIAKFVEGQHPSYSFAVHDRCGLLIDFVRECPLGPSRNTGQVEPRRRARRLRAAKATATTRSQFLWRAMLLLLPFVSSTLLLQAGQSLRVSESSTIARSSASRTRNSFPNGPARQVAVNAGSATQAWLASPKVAARAGRAEALLEADALFAVANGRVLTPLEHAIISDNFGVGSFLVWAHAPAFRSCQGAPEDGRIARGGGCEFSPAAKLCHSDSRRSEYERRQGAPRGGRIA